MPIDPERLDQELAILADLHRESDPLLASLVASPSSSRKPPTSCSPTGRSRRGLVGPSVVDRVTRSEGRGLLMCGVCGVVSFTEPPDLGLLTEMMRRLTHRGPDGCGYYRDRHAALGHTTAGDHRSGRRRSATRQRGRDGLGDLQR